ncbi:MAG: hypothetical protein AAF654_08725 [Myxococcota bacterium]
MINGYADAKRLAQRVSAEQQADRINDLKEKLESQTAQFATPIAIAAIDGGASVHPPKAATLPIGVPEALEAPLNDAPLIMTVAFTGDDSGAAFHSLDAAAQPPDVRSHLTQWLADYDVNASGRLEPDELSAAFAAQGVSVPFADMAANSVFRMMGRLSAGPDDVDRLQDAFTAAWLSAAPERARALFQEGSSVDIHHRLLRRDFSDALIDSVERVLGDELFQKRRRPWGRLLFARDALRREDGRRSHRLEHALRPGAELARALTQGTDSAAPSLPGVVATLTHPSGIQITTPAMTIDGAYSPLAVDLTRAERPPVIGGAFAHLLDQNNDKRIDQNEFTTHLVEHGTPRDQAEELAQAVFRSMRVSAVSAAEVRQLQDGVVRAWIAANPERAELLLHINGSGHHYSSDEVSTGLQRRGWPPALANSFTSATIGRAGQSLWRGQAEARIRQLGNDLNFRRLADSMQIASLFVQAHLRAKAATNVSELLESTLGLKTVAPVFTTAREWVPDLTDAEQPPEVGPGLIDALVTADANEDRGLSQAELTAYFAANGFGSERADRLATQLFSALDTERLELDDMQHLQDAMTAAWIAADPVRAKSTLEGLHKATILRSPRDSVGWSRELQASLERVVGSVHRRHGWHGAVDELAASPANQAIVESSTAASLLEEAEAALPNTVNAPWLRPHPEPIPALNLLEAAGILARHQPHVSRALRYFRRSEHVSIDELRRAFASTGLQQKESDLLARAVMTRAAIHLDETSLPQSVRGDAFDSLM